MNKKGQIFSIDLLFASVIAILLIGVLINIMEIKNYEQKENILNSSFNSSSEAALNVLLNGKYSCEFNEINLANSIDRGKLFSTNIQDLEKELGLVDKNFEIWTIDTAPSAPIKSKGEISGENIKVYELEFLDCEFTGLGNEEILESLIDLMQGSSGNEFGEKNTLLFKVSK